MITLHEVHKRDGEDVKAAVLAFGARHPFDGARPDAEPDWKWAEKHFTRLIEVIMGTAALAQTRSTDTVHLAEDEAVQLLLTLNTVPRYRCPICVKQQRDAL
ncbi:MULTISPECIES: hypothetical protein [Streptomyces]|uniref:hypothetical protein n=1 Tax=Streptomyces TaxID=1883 RepID=UPI002250EFC2|nr:MULTISPECIES: hypothetical protein [Streptomyces]MCX4429879.1 hypothetical protein [Streptomyces mirabilis]